MKAHTMNDTQLKRVHKYLIDPADSKKTTVERFLNIDNGHMGGTNWTCFNIKDN